MVVVKKLHHGSHGALRILSTNGILLRLAPYSVSLILGNSHMFIKLIQRTWEGGAGGRSAPN